MNLYSYAAEMQCIEIKLKKTLFTFVLQDLDGKSFEDLEF